MSDSFNPFAKWLGLNPKVKNPHHFQLLGVSPKLKVPTEIQKAVDAGVKKKLALLAKVPPGQHDDVIEKIKQRLAIAQKTLSDTKSREAYLEQLKQQVKSQLSSKGAGTPPDKATGTLPARPAAAAKSMAAGGPQAKPIPPDHDSLLPPPRKPVTATPPSANIPNGPSIPTVTSQTNAEQITAPAESPIPMAVPLATPATSDGSTESPELGGIAVNADGMPIDEVRIEKTIRRRSNSKVGLIFAIFMLIAAAVGGFLIYQNFDGLMKLGGVNPNTVEPSGVVKDETGKNNKTAVIESDTTPKTVKAATLPELDLDNLPEVNVDEIMEHPQTSAATNRSPEFEKAYAARVKARLEKMGLADDEDLGDADSTTDSNSTSVEPGDDPLVEPETPTAKNIVTLDESQLARFRRHIERARRSLYRREKSVALKAIESANRILQEVRKTEDDAFAPEQSQFPRIADESKEIHDLIDGFWGQVVASCQKIPGGQEINSGGQVIAFVEADQDKIIVRNAGSNVTYRYYFCPAGLAVTLANEGTIADIPIWSKQQAAFFALNEVYGVNHKIQIDKLLRVAEQAGHDCQGIRHFAEFDFGSIGKPKVKIVMPKRNDLDDAMAEFRTENEYTEIGKLEPGTAGMLAELVLHVDSPNFEQHVAFLEEARKLAIQSGEAAKAEDAIIELDNFADIERAQLSCDTFSDISKSKLTNGQKRTLMEIAISFLKSEFGSFASIKSRQLLAKRLMALAIANDMTDVIRRLNQLN